MTTLASFWDRVDRRGPDECWPWKGRRQSGDGYGLLGHEYAHRIALEIAVGRPLASSEWALHHCDSPPCVNPRHLFLGDVAANNRDMFAKGRHLASRSWDCPDCGSPQRAVRGPGKLPRCPECAALATKAKRRRAYLAWRPTVPLKDPAWRSRRRSSCPRGHEMAGDNVYESPQGRRMCRACIALRSGPCNRADPMQLPEAS